MTNKDTTWLIKTNEGKIYGPYRYEKLFLFIEKGMIQGDEMIAEYPNGEWFAVSKDMELNSKLLEELEKQINDKPKEEIAKEFERHSEIKDPNEKTSSSSKKKIQKESKKEEKPLIEADEDWQEEDEPGTSSVSFTSKTIDVERKKPNTKRIGRFLLVIGVLALFFLYLSENADPTKPQVIIAPDFNKKTENINRKDFSKNILVALNHYKEGEKRNYIRSRNILIPIIEADPTNTDAIALLCLNYKELWDFSNQSSQERKVMSRLVEASTKVETFSASAITCKAVQSFLEGNWVQAQGFVERVLNQDTNAVSYYFLKAEILNSLGRPQESLAYYQQAYRYWPGWLLARLKEGLIRERLGKVSQARQIWQKILSLQSTNESASIFLAHTTYFRFQNSKRAKIYIDNFQKENSGAKPEWQAKGYEVLAGLNENDNKEKSIEYAKLALERSVNSPYAAAILERQGGRKEVSKKSSADAYMANGDFMASQNRHFEAQAEYKTAFDLDPKNSLAAMKAAKSLWQIDQEKEAIAWLNKALESDPKNLEASLLLAQYYGERYNFLAAANQIKRAQKIDRKDYRLYQVLAKLELQRLNYKGAVDYAESALSRYDADIDSLYILARAEIKRGNYREAHYATSKAVNLEVNNPSSQALYAETLSYFQSFQAGVDYIKNLINTYPSNLEYRLALAKIYYLDDQYDSAIKVLKQIESHDTDKLKLYDLMADIYKAKGDYSSALEALLSAAQARPSSVDVYVNLGKLHMESEKYKNALEQFLVAHQLNDNYPRLNSLIGKAYLKLGRYGKALEHAEREIQRNPKLVDGYLLAGEVYNSNGQYSKAAGQFQKVIQMDPNSSDLYIRIARAHRLAGNFDLARSMLSVASSKESGNPEIYKETGALLDSMGKPEEAVTAYKKYLKLSPNAADRSVIKQIISKLGG